MCYSTVVSEMLKSNLKNYDRVTAPKPSHQQNINEGAWNDTTIIIVGGISKLSMQSIDKLIAGGQFSDSWRLLLKYFTELLNRQALDVSTAVLNGMAKILLEIDDVEKIGRNSITKVWNIWQMGNPACHVDNSRGNHGNQESIAAYLDLFHQIHRLVGENFLPDQIQTITEQLRSCIIDSDVAPYSKDLDNLTAVQKHVLESLRMIPTKVPGALSTVIDSITNFVVMAFNDRLTKKGHTYVALSKAAMDLLGSCIDEHLQMRRIQSPALLIKAIDSLTIPLRLKYKFTNDGKEPALWRKATTTALFILEACVSKSSAMTDDPAFWNVVLDISDGILAADGLSNMKYSEISQDQVFDINAFSRMRHILTSKITRLNIPDTVRRKYAESIFKNSIIHDPHPDDLAKPGQELLHGLQRSHIGRTQDLAPTRRSKLSYILLNELFSLVAGNSCSPERQRLAQASAPFLILRAGITLKAFVFDQPLRGQMPQPLSQKRELLYILQKLLALDSEPGAIPDAPEITSKHQKHLHLLYPLIIQATAVAWRDEEVSSALRALLEAFGQDFGV